MRNNFLAAFGVGLAIIALAVGGIFLMQRGDRIELPGKILKVRTAPAGRGQLHRRDRFPHHQSLGHPVRGAHRDRRDGR